MFHPPSSGPLRLSSERITPKENGSSELGQWVVLWRSLARLPGGPEALDLAPGRCQVLDQERLGPASGAPPVRVPKIGIVDPVHPRRDSGVGKDTAIDSPGSPAVVLRRHHNHLFGRQIASSPLVSLDSASPEPSFFSSVCERTIFETSTETLGRRAKLENEVRT